MWSCVSRGWPIVWPGDADDLLMITFCDLGLLIAMQVCGQYEYDVQCSTKELAEFFAIAVFLSEQTNCRCSFVLMGVQTELTKAILIGAQAKSEVVSFEKFL